MLRSVLATAALAFLIIETGAQTVCEQLMAGTWHFPERREFVPEKKEICLEKDNPVGAKFQRRAEATTSTSNSTSSGAVGNVTTLWLIEDVYKGETFFDKWDFWNAPDPTHGTVNYVNRTFAFANNLTAITDSGQVMMKGDDKNWIPEGAFRDSVRISSQKRYNAGTLLILDVARAPWGCGVWPAFWTVGDNWPAEGEIDIIEGVHDNQYNQVAWHASPGCYYTQNATYSGQLKTTQSGPNTDCNGCINDNSGCGVNEWSHASYGEFFESTGGGVYAMKWDNESIAVWTFYRSSVPEDITAGKPDPTKWGPPTAVLTNQNCDIKKFFRNHVIVFNITFCGDWAGNSYGGNCPGTCAQRLMDPANFVNATWLINSLHVYQKTVINGTIHRENAALFQLRRPSGNLMLFLVLISVLLIS